MSNSCLKPKALDNGLPLEWFGMWILIRVNLWPEKVLVPQSVLLHDIEKQLEWQPKPQLCPSPGKTKKMDISDLTPLPPLYRKYLFTKLSMRYDMVQELGCRGFCFHAETWINFQSQ